MTDTFKPNYSFRKKLLENCEIKNRGLSKVVATLCVLKNSYLTDLFLKNGVSSNNRIDSCSIVRCILDDLTIKDNSELSGIHFIETELNGLFTLDSSINYNLITNTTFKKAFFGSGTTFYKTAFCDCLFDECDFTSVVFRECTFTGCLFRRCKTKDNKELRFENCEFNPLRPTQIFGNMFETTSPYKFMAVKPNFVYGASWVVVYQGCRHMFDWKTTSIDPSVQGIRETGYVPMIVGCNNGYEGNLTAFRCFSSSAEENLEDIQTSDNEDKISAAKEEKPDNSQEKTKHKHMAIRFCSKGL